MKSIGAVAPEPGFREAPAIDRPWTLEGPRRRRPLGILLLAGCLAAVLLAACGPDQRAEVDRLKTELSGAQSQLAALQTERDALRTERDALRTARDALQSERDALCTKADDLGRANDQLSAQNRELQGRLKTAQDENEALRKDLAAAQGTVKVLANLMLEARRAGKWIGEFVVQPTWAWIEKLARDYRDAAPVSPTFN